MNLYDIVYEFEEEKIRFTLNPSKLNAEILVLPIQLLLPVPNTTIKLTTISCTSLSYRNLPFLLHMCIALTHAVFILP